MNLKRAQIPIEVYSVLLEWTDLWKRSRQSAQSRDLKRVCTAVLSSNSILVDGFFQKLANTAAISAERKKEARLKKSFFSLIA